jgi:hypothetical protein
MDYMRGNMQEIDVDQVAEIHRQIERVLLREWDPIGLKDVPEAQDEYRGYCRGVYDVAVQTRSARAVSEHLLKIEQEVIGLSFRSADTLVAVAQKILDLVVDAGPLP